MPVFAEYQPDFYEKDFTEQQYVAQLNKIAAMKAHEALCITSKGLEVVGRVWQAVYRVLGFLGFERPTHVIRVEYELLKLLHYGASHNYLNNTQIKAAIESVKVSQGFAPHAHHFAELGGASMHKVHTLTDGATTDAQFTERLQGDLQQYYRRHSATLRPSAYRYCFAQRIYQTVNHFGATYVALADQLLPHRRNGVSERQVMQSVHCFSRAVAVNNRAKGYQEYLLENMSSANLLSDCQNNVTFTSSAMSRVNDAMRTLYINALGQNLGYGYFKLIVEKSSSMPQTIREDSILKPFMLHAHLKHAESFQKEQMKERIQLLEKGIKEYASTDESFNKDAYEALIRAYHQNDQHEKVVECFRKMSNSARKVNAKVAFEIASQWASQTDSPHLDKAIVLCELSEINKDSSANDKKVYQTACVKKIESLLKGGGIGGAVTTVAAAVGLRPDNRPSEAWDIYYKASHAMNVTHLDMSTFTYQQLLDARSSALIEREEEEAKLLRHLDIMQRLYWKDVEGGLDYFLCRVPFPTLECLNTMLLNMSSTAVENLLLKLRGCHSYKDIGFAVAAQMVRDGGNDDAAIRLFEHLGITAGDKKPYKEAYSTVCLRKMEGIFSASQTYISKAAQTFGGGTPSANALPFYEKARKMNGSLSLHCRAHQNILNAMADQVIVGETDNDLRSRHYQIAAEYNRIYLADRTKYAAIRLPEATAKYWRSQFKDDAASANPKTPEEWMKVINELEAIV